MCSPASSKILYRNPRFLRVAFLQLHHQQQSGVFCDALLQAEGKKIKGKTIEGKMNSRPEVNNKPRRMFLPINIVNW